VGYCPNLEFSNDYFRNMNNTKSAPSQMIATVAMAHLMTVTAKSSPERVEDSLNDCGSGGESGVAGVA